MEDEPLYPTFGEADRALFAMEDARERADTLQSELVPKLKELLNVALFLIDDAYGVDPFEQSVITASPAHRKDAKTTKRLETASVGLVPSRRGKKYHYFKLVFVMDVDGFVTMLQSSRPAEAHLLFDLMKKHDSRVVEVLDLMGCGVWSIKGIPEGADNLTAIRSMRIDDEQQWWHCGLGGAMIDHPVNDQSRIHESVMDFIGLFSVYQAVVELINGQEEQFEQYADRLQEWLTEDEEKAEAVGREEEKDEIPETPVRIEQTVSRIVRDTAMSRRVKQLYDYKCQICGEQLETRDGMYAEGAHIRPLGSPHDGPDTEDNILCLCPNHHVLLDRGGFTIADDLSLIGIEGRITLVTPHLLNPHHLAYHRRRYETS